MKNFLSIIILLTLINSSLLSIYSNEKIYKNLPIKKQIILILTVFKYNKNFLRKLDDKIRIGLFYKNKSKSVQYKNKFMKIFIENFSKKTFFNKKIEIIPINSLKKIEKSRFNIVILAPKTRDKIPELLKITEKKNISSATGICEYLNTGISIVVGTKEHKNLLAINVKTSIKENCCFSAKLLQLAYLIKNEN